MAHTHRLRSSIYRFRLSFCRWKSSFNINSNWYCFIIFSSCVSVSSATIGSLFLSWSFVIWQFDMNRGIQANTRRDFFKLNLVSTWCWCLPSFLIVAFNISFTAFFSTSCWHSSVKSASLRLVNSKWCCVVFPAPDIIVHPNAVYSATGSPLFSILIFRLVWISVFGCAYNDIYR